MIGRQEKWYVRVWRRPVTVLGMLSLLVLIGLGIFNGGRYLWARQRLQEAKQALESGDLPRARANLRLCLEACSDWPAVHLLAARAARRDAAYDDAAWHLSECRRLQGAADAVDLESALLRVQRGDLSRDEDFLVGCVQENHPDTPLILEALTKGYAQTHRLPQALRSVRAWVERQPDNIQALYWRGQIWEKMYYFREALNDYRRAVELDPEEDDARLRLAQRLLEAGQAKEALTHFEWLVERQPGHVAILLGIARCLSDLGRLDDSSRLLDRLLTAHPTDGLALIERGKVALQSNLPTEAERWLRKAVLAVPYERTANYLLYQCLLRLGNKEEAQVFLARSERIGEDQKRLVEVTRQMTQAIPDPALCYEAGVILLRNGQDQEGVRWLTSALAADPHYGPAQRALAAYRQGTATSLPRKPGRELSR